MYDQSPPTLSDQYEQFGKDVAYVTKHNEGLRLILKRLQCNLLNIPILSERDPSFLVGGLYSMMARIFLSLGEYDNAICNAMKAVRKGWERKGVRSTIAWAMYLLPGDEVKGCRAALAQFHEGVIREGPTPEAFYGRALMLKELKQYRMAERDFRQIIVRAPKYPLPYVDYADLLLIKGDYDEALYTIEFGLAHSPDEPFLLAGLARIVAAKGDFERALEAIRKIPDEERSFESRLLEIESLLKLGRYLEGRKVAFRCANEFPGEPYALVQLVSAELLCQRPIPALRFANRCLELDVAVPDSYTVRGIARIRNNNILAGVVDLENAQWEVLELPYLLFGDAIHCATVEALEPAYAVAYHKLCNPRQLPPPPGSDKIGTRKRLTMLLGLVSLTGAIQPPKGRKPPVRRLHRHG